MNRELTPPKQGFLGRLREDESGAIMVIAIFMSACIVGCIWYMYGLGEAMVYRQELRAASDATAFESAVMHAVGMNAIAMINIAMAIVLSVLVLLQIVFVLLLVLTVLAALLLLIPGVDLLDAGIMPPLLDADETMFNVISKVQEPVFGTLTFLNIGAGVEAIVMPWVAHFSAHNAPDDYAPAAQEGDFWQPFSWSMIPNRIPFFSNYFESWAGDKFGKLAWSDSWKKKLPILDKIPDLAAIKNTTGLAINPAKLLTSRYGLPVQDDKYPVLCQHATQELFDEFGSLIGLVTGQLTGGGSGGPDLSGIGYWFGVFIGSFPGIFCSGVDPMVAVSSELGLPVSSKTAQAVIDIFKPLSFLPWFKTFNKIASSAKDATSKGSLTRFSMYPMKPYDMFQNGNGFGQIWAIIKGDESLTTGASTGVDIASWGTSAFFGDTGPNSVDFAEAEFYYDCGPNAGAEAGGRSDTDGIWNECKYNAMWNMKWKARLRRYHEFDLDAAKMAELAVYNGLGAEGMIQKFLKFVPVLGDPFGVGAKYSIIDSIKSCLTSIGQGKSGTVAFGACPIPMGGPSGGGDVDIGWNSAAPGVTDYSKVLH
jgi:hypothetical protein